tara:strand:+ start:2137 stop:2310 length:174 start_codon:yes stop_codon:yes gene_type:complete
MHQDLIDDRLNIEKLLGRINLNLTGEGGFNGTKKEGLHPSDIENIDLIWLLGHVDFG